MDNIFCDLKCLGYENPRLKENIVQDPFIEGPVKGLFCDIITWLSSQLAATCNLDSQINPINQQDGLDSNGLYFQIEVSTLLNELCCPLKILTTGPIEDRFITKEEKLILVLYLCTELKAAKIHLHNKSINKACFQSQTNMCETTKILKEIMIYLGIGELFHNITLNNLFTEIESKIKALSLPCSPKEIVGHLLITECLSDKQWFTLNILYHDMHDEYKTRRNLLLTRLDLTFKSFLWPETHRSKKKDILTIYDDKIRSITIEPNVRISNVLSANYDVIQSEKLNDVVSHCKSIESVYKIIIGNIPDRGGRPQELQPPPPEVPNWKQNRTALKGREFKNKNEKYGHHKQEQIKPSVQHNFHLNSESFHTYQCENNILYQQTPFCPIGTFGFGYRGHLPAGDNFQHYGVTDGLQRSRPNLKNRNVRNRHNRGISTRGLRWFQQ